MTYHLLIRPLAYMDMDDAREWYESIQAGRGEEFLRELHGRLLEIQAAPELHGKVRSRVRAARMRKSEFLIYFRIDDDLVTVIAVQHSRAHPKRWQRRR